MSPTPVPHACWAFLNDFSAFIDGELPAARRNEHQAHVDCCQACLAHLAAYRRGITVLRSVEEAAPADFWTRLERRLWLGPELSVVDGEAVIRPSRRSFWPSPAMAMATAAVLALFVIARGLGPGSTGGEVGPRSVSASVAMTVPEVPRSEGPAMLAGEVPSGDEVRSVPRRSGSFAGAETAATDPAAAVLARVESGPAPSFERELRRLQESVSRQSLVRQSESRLMSDGWVQPVHLGGETMRASIVPAVLVRPAAAVTPAPWNVDHAVSLP